jgi:hypothetical protein
MWKLTPNPCLESSLSKKADLIGVLLKMFNS